MRTRLDFKLKSGWIALLVSALFWQGCTHHFSLPADSRAALYEIAGNGPEAGHLPAFLAYGHGGRT